MMKNQLKLYSRSFNLGTSSETIKYNNASGEIKQKDFESFNKCNIFVNSLKENGYELSNNLKQISILKRVGLISCPFFVNYFLLSLQYEQFYKGRTLWQGTRTAIRKRTIKESINFKYKDQWLRKKQI